MTMYHRPLTLPKNRRNLIERAIAADDSCVSVARLATMLGHFGPRVAGLEPSESIVLCGIVAIARLIQLARREERLAPEQYAKKLGIGLDELEAAESGTRVSEPRVLY